MKTPENPECWELKFLAICHLPGKYTACVDRMSALVYQFPDFWVTLVFLPCEHT